MPRPARHRITLTEEEHAGADAACAGGEAAVSGCAARPDRAQCRSPGCRTREIAARLDTTARIVGKWRRDGSSTTGWKGSRTSRARGSPAPGRPRRFPPQQVAEVKAIVKAIACELPATRGVPLLSKFSRVELHRLVIERGVTDASASTIWRWLHEGRDQPRQTRSWIFARDPQFAEKAGRVLDLYARVFEGKRLYPDESVICADEETQRSRQLRV